MLTHLTCKCLGLNGSKYNCHTSIVSCSNNFAVYRMAMAFRGVLRTVARRLQVRNYADAPKGDEMALTFAAGNKVFFKLFFTVYSTLSFFY